MLSSFVCFKLQKKNIAQNRRYTIWVVLLLFCFLRQRRYGLTDAYNFSGGIYPQYVKSVNLQGEGSIQKLVFFLFSPFRFHFIFLIVICF